jgi:hypothetical protein
MNTIFKKLKNNINYFQNHSHITHLNEDIENIFNFNVYSYEFIAKVLRDNVYITNDLYEDYPNKLMEFFIYLYQNFTIYHWRKKRYNYLCKFRDLDDYMNFINDDVKDLGNKEIFLVIVELNIIIHITYELAFVVFFMKENDITEIEKICDIFELIKINSHRI